MRCGAMAFSDTTEYKIILLGEPGVGKTNYFFRLRDGVFVGSSVSTVSQGVEHMTFKTVVDGDEIKVLNTDGQPSLFWSAPLDNMRCFSASTVSFIHGWCTV